ncbi:MAG: UDP-N-acetylmuramoyl-L-alanine--D-glutamate ligase [Bacteroidales bacterium]
MNNLEEIRSIFHNKKILIWGFGKEGKSTYKLIKEICPDQEVDFLDQDTEMLSVFFSEEKINTTRIIDKNISQEELELYDMIVKSPGVNVSKYNFQNLNIRSQADIFIQIFRNQIIGITGSKGKSTVASLTYHLLNKCNIHCLLGGNIGIPPFDLIKDITEKSLIVLELSAHQLEFCKHSPRISILLNLFEEHLDHFGSFENYAQAKMNIMNWQSPGDLFFCNQEIDYFPYTNKEIFPLGHCIKSSLEQNDKASLFMQGARLLLKFGPIEYKLCGFLDYVTLPGKHNLFNSMIATAASLVCGADPLNIRKGFYSYETLDHRLQFAGIFGGMKCYNDSISTIPQSTIEALNTLEKTDILLLGGYDRGIDYSCLTERLKKESPRVIICMREAGKRIYDEIKNHTSATVLFTSSLAEAMNRINELKKKEDVCLLSPAAASYGEFKNFEERGKEFIKILRELQD